MVYKIIKLRGQDTYRIFCSLTGKIYSEHPTKEEAKVEIHNLENQVETPTPTPTPTPKKSKGRPKKYATVEEARTARIAKTKESNARMKLKKQEGKGIGYSLLKDLIL